MNTEFTGKTVLVTGGAGLVGSHLTEALLEKGANVLVIDDFSNGMRENLEMVQDDITIIEGDISAPFTEIKELFEEYTIDAIYNLACYPRSLSLQNPFRDVDVNARGTINMLELARVHGNAKVLFSSNSGIYGTPQYVPTDEKHPDHPTTPYDANKLVSEYYMKIYNEIYDLPVAIFRFAAVYGDRQRTKPGWKPVIPEFVGRVLANDPPTICWDGDQTRDLIYVKDIVQGLIKAYAAETGREVYILGTGVETSINDMYNTICDELGIKLEPNRTAKTPGDIRRMQFDCTKARETFGFKPEYSLRDGIKAYIAWYNADKAKQEKK